MTPREFIGKWKDNPLKERASYQLHFINLCALVGVPHPSPVSHNSYCFERGATRTGAGQGWADVWKQGYFAFEYKATRRNLGEVLNKLHDNWLNPPEWTEWLRTPEEETAGYPLRPVAKPGHEADLKKRTLTNLYNSRPAWLDNAHKTLDAAVAKAYGWNDYTPVMADEEILRRLLALNLAYAE